jgi:hypothetical protein
MPRSRFGAHRGARVLLGLAAAMLTARLGADEVQLAPFAGLQFGGHVYSPFYGATFSLKESANFGATLDFALDETWRLELLYSRQETELRPPASPAPVFPQKIEHYMVGIEEELQSESAVRFFGVALLGATRLVPATSGADSELRFAAAFSLGAKVAASKRLGFRFEARAFYTVVESGAAVFCRQGVCLFQFNGSGVWQGDVTGALVLRF